MAAPDEVELLPRNGQRLVLDDEDDQDPMTSTPVPSGRIQGYGNTSSLNRRPGASVLFQGLFFAPAAAPSERSLAVRPSGGVWSGDTLANIVWMTLFGWWISVGYLFAAIPLFVSFIGIPYGRLCLTLAYFHLWPFGKFLVRSGPDAPAAPLSMEGAGGILGHGLYLFFISLFTMPCYLASFGLSWLVVVFIPMAKTLRTMMGLLYHADPLSLSVRSDPSGDVVCAVHCSFNAHYYRYTMWGINIILFNLSPFVLFSLFVAYPLPYFFGVELPAVILFIFSLASIIPLSYYIGMAISNIAAQTSFAVGALINATFGSIIELIIYWAAIRQGELDQMVQAAVTGTLLGMLLLLPGLSMICGGLMYPDQKFSAEAAGVSSVLLIVSIIGAFTPTIFFQIYGGYQLECIGCKNQTQTAYLPSIFNESDPFYNTTLFQDTLRSFNTATLPLDCWGCQLLPPNKLDEDEVFNTNVRPLMYVCAAILPLAYGVGLLFTLKTHQHLFASEGSGHGGEEAPSQLWSIKKCVVVLLCCTVAFALISDEMAAKMSVVLDQYGIDQAFAGLTIIGIIPSIAEYAAAVMFAMNDNVALSIEIGSSSAVQLSLIQIPVLVALSAIHKTFFNPGEQGFTLIFPPMDLFAVIFAVIIVNYVSIDGRSNYFVGSALVIIYALLVAAFYFVPTSHRYPENA